MSKETQLKLAALRAYEEMCWELAHKMLVLGDLREEMTWKCPFCKANSSFSQRVDLLPHAKNCLMYDFNKATNDLRAALAPYEEPWKEIGAHSVL